VAVSTVDLSLRSGENGFASMEDALKRGDTEFKAAAKTRFGKDIAKARKELVTRIEAIRKEVPGIPLNAVTENPGEPAPLQIHLRGSAHALGDPVTPGFPAVLASLSDSNPSQATQSGSIETDSVLPDDGWPWPVGSRTGIIRSPHE